MAPIWHQAWCVLETSACSWRKCRSQSCSKSRFNGSSASLFVVQTLSKTVRGLGVFRSSQSCDNWVVQYGTWCVLERADVRKVAFQQIFPFLLFRCRFLWFLCVHLRCSKCTKCSSDSGLLATCISRVSHSCVMAESRCGLEPLPCKRLFAVPQMSMVLL